MHGRQTTLMVAEIDWIQFIVTCGLTAALIAVGVYAALAIREWMSNPVDYETVGDDLDSLRRALELGSIDEDEYRRGVQALQSMSEKLNQRNVEPLKPEVLLSAIAKVGQGSQAGGSMVGAGSEGRAGNVGSGSRQPRPGGKAGEMGGEWSGPSGTIPDPEETPDRREVPDFQEVPGFQGVIGQAEQETLSQIHGLGDQTQPEIRRPDAIDDDSRR